MKCGHSVLLLILVVSGLNAQTFKNSATWNNVTTSFGSVGTLKWQDDAAGGNVIFRVEKSAAGFIAFGLGSGMADADIVVIEKNVAGSTVTLKNCKTKGQVTPVCTESGQDYTLLAADSFSITASSMTVEFKRSYNGTKADGDKPFYNGANSLIWAHATTDTLSQHDGTSRGTVSLTLTLPNQVNATTGNNTTGNGSKSSSSNLQISLLAMPLLISILAIGF